MAKTTKPTAGRPPMPPSERRRNRFFFSLTDDEMRRVSRAAAKLGLGHTEWSRQAVLEAAR